MARHLACETGYRYIDSGAMYRAVTLYALRNGMISADGSTVDAAALEAALPEIRIDFAPAVNGQPQHTLLNGEDVESEIRGMKVSSSVSPVAAIAAVRRTLTAMQQAFGEEKGIVMDGRDIGTTVFPDAEMKVFVTASAETRARRRVDELEAKGQHVDFEEVLANVVERDNIDRNRAESPLRKADDAVELDNSDITIDEQNRFLLDLYHKIVSGKQS